MHWFWELASWCLVPYALLVLVQWIIRRILVLHWGKSNISEVSMRGKVVLVTGAGSGVGFETAAALANRGATVVVTGRTVKAAKKVEIKIRNKTFLGKLIPLPLDLSSLESISKFCQAVKEKIDHLDLLINNAGVLVPVTKRQTSVDGFEIHLAVNHLGHFLLTSLLLPLMKKNPSRIIIVSSMGHRGVSINFEDLMFEKTEIHDTSISGNVLYQQSKLLNILFGQELRRRLQKIGADIKVYICCPGVVKTKISRHLDLPWFTSLLEPVYGFILKTPLEGSQTILHCATEAEGEQCILYRHCKAWNPGFKSYPDDFFTKTAATNYSEEDARKMWSQSERLCGKAFEV